MGTTYKGATYEEVSVPASNMRLIYPRNTFSAEIINDHATISISTDSSGIPAVIRKLEVLAGMMAMEIEQPEIIRKFSVEGSAAEDDAHAHPQQSGKE